MSLESPRIAASAPRYGPQGPSGGSHPSGIFLPALNYTVSIAAYCAAIRKARANPDARFAHSLDGWWPATGAEIMRQFRQVRNARITAGRPIRRPGDG
jgi:hypothetical protein